MATILFSCSEIDLHGASSEHNPATKWERMMVRIGKALKRQSISPEFYLDLFEVLFFSLGKVNPEIPVRADKSWRRYKNKAVYTSQSLGKGLNLLEFAV